MLQTDVKKGKKHHFSTANDNEIMFKYSVAAVIYVNACLVAQTPMPPVS